MRSPLTYQPQMVIEGKVEFPPVYKPPDDKHKWVSGEVGFELFMLAVELVADSLFNHL
jgi:hypothetical protein